MGPYQFWNYHIEENGADCCVHAVTCLSLFCVPSSQCHVSVCDLNFDIIQLMHSFEVNIRICQPENSDVHRGEAEVNITFEG